MVAATIDAPVRAPAEPPRRTVPDLPTADQIMDWAEELHLSLVPGDNVFLEPIWNGYQGCPVGVIALHEARAAGSTATPLRFEDAWHEGAQPPDWLLGLSDGFEGVARKPAATYSRTVLNVIAGPLYPEGAAVGRRVALFCGKDWARNGR